MKKLVLIIMMFVSVGTIADTNYIVPGAGIIQDQQDGFSMIIPGVGIYQAQEAATSSAGQVIMMMGM